MAFDSRTLGDAVTRRLSPSEKTAMVAISKSTHDGSGLSERQIMTELMSNMKPDSLDRIARNNRPTIDDERMRKLRDKNERDEREAKKKRRDIRGKDLKKTREIPTRLSKNLEDRRGWSEQPFQTEKEQHWKAVAIARRIGIKEPNKWIGRRSS